MLDQFREIWACDFEFSVQGGELPTVLCMVATEYRTRRTFRLWADELELLFVPPFNIGADALFVAYYATAELSCFLQLGWPLPERILDLYAEFRALTNGRPLPLNIKGKPDRSLVGALVYFGLDHMGAVEKEEMRARAMLGGYFSPEERTGMLDYCASDVRALCQLLPKMTPYLGNAHQVCLRGAFMRAAAQIERAGIPIDTQLFERFIDNWSDIEFELINRVDRDYGLFVDGSFNFARFNRWLSDHSIPWPRTFKGRLAVDKDTFREMARIYPEVASLQELKATLGELRLHELAVGQRDGRNRAMLSPFGANSGRNTPSSKHFIFGPATWLRGLIKPCEGYALAYLDFSSEEFAIGAALSGDPAMISAYASGDPYLAFGKQIGLIPFDGTRERHEVERNCLKTCVLGIQYGMQDISLARRIDRSRIEARYIIQAHRQTYRNFWRWSDGAVARAMGRGCLQTVFGWPIYPFTPQSSNPRSLRNFPLQANGSEILRLGCCFVQDCGIQVIAPVHDALLIEAPEECIDEQVKLATEAMQEASRWVLGGFEIRVDCKIVRYPDRFMDKRGQRMWDAVKSILTEVETSRRRLIDVGRQYQAVSI